MVGQLTVFKIWSLKKLIKKNYLLMVAKQNMYN